MNSSALYRIEDDRKVLPKVRWDEGCLGEGAVERSVRIQSDKVEFLVLRKVLEQRLAVWLHGKHLAADIYREEGASIRVADDLVGLNGVGRGIIIHLPGSGETS